MHRSVAMGNTSVVKVDSAFSQVGAMGQHYLASGTEVGMRLWRDEAPTSVASPGVHTRRDYEVVGFVLRGRAELEIEGQCLMLAAGDSYWVPRGALHKYTVLETFSAVEATAPPARADGRDLTNLPEAPRPEHALR